jgi:hypothetical protein
MLLLMLPELFKNKNFAILYGENRASGGTVRQVIKTGTPAQLSSVRT